MPQAGFRLRLRRLASASCCSTCDTRDQRLSACTLAGAITGVSADGQTIHAEPRWSELFFARLDADECFRPHPYGVTRFPAGTSR